MKCADCGAEIAQRMEKALNGEWAILWADTTAEWVCPKTGNEHRKEQS